MIVLCPFPPATTTLVIKVSIASIRCNTVTAELSCLSVSEETNDIVVLVINKKITHKLVPDRKTLNQGWQDWLSGNKPFRFTKDIGLQDAVLQQNHIRDTIWQCGKPTLGTIGGPTKMNLGSR
ncbi:hypothetical protein J6590_061604 [Homalodisca vitripennis]|nr:hypothetical protein J6590_061604 [Homalodisca vitripennis]